MFLCEFVLDQLETGKPYTDTLLQKLASAMGVKKLNIITFFRKKMSERQTKAGNQEHSLTLSLSHLITLDMLNNFCFHVYAQKSLS